MFSIFQGGRLQDLMARGMPAGPGGTAGATLRLADLLRQPQAQPLQPATQAQPFQPMNPAQPMPLAPPQPQPNPLMPTAQGRFVGTRFGNTWKF